MKRAIFVFIVIGIVGLMFSCSTSPGASDEVKTSGNTFTLWQLPNQTNSQMMSYVIRSVGGKIVVIDGGTSGDAPYLRDFLKKQGGAVEAWFITHPHSDHCNALVEILKDLQGLTIGSIYASLPESAWIEEVADPSEKKTYADLMAALSRAQCSVSGLELGEKLVIDGIHIRILGIKNPEIKVNPINNSCVVMRVSDKQKSVLFLADLGAQGGRKLLSSKLARHLPSEYVQMAHHGQNGVNEDVYKAINPGYCLWPAPLWLWDNNPGSGKGTGHWKTLEVRAWMEKFPIKRHYLLFEGLQEIR
ncbi:MAG TPA: MBL fold metallo-hydrolase [Candidatus Hydrogenedentes bacterium]|nr:MBL fold metallo-hydrolase [Candidatus Hydrogenedentota bacterium]